MLEKELQKYDIENQYQWVKKHNINLNPYHNTEHIERVTLFTIMGCEWYFDSIGKYGTEIAATAALFHDFGHSGGKLKDDSDNIKLAIDGLLKFNQEVQKFNQSELDMIASIIDATRFPYLNHSDNLTLLQNIVRDSDIIQGLLHPDYFTKIVEPIAKEAGIPFSDFLKGQEKFWDSLEFGTGWASKLFEDFNQTKKPLFIKTINQFLSEKI